MFIIDDAAAAPMNEYERNPAAVDFFSLPRNGGEYIFCASSGYRYENLGLGRTASAATQVYRQDDSSIVFSVISTRSVIGRANNHSQHMWRGVVGALSIYSNRYILPTII